jgi:hypothetical protein
VPKERPKAFYDVPWGLYKEMPTRVSQILYLTQLISEIKCLNYSKQTSFYNITRYRCVFALNFATGNIAYDRLETFPILHWSKFAATTLSIMADGCVMPSVNEAFYAECAPKFFHMPWCILRSSESAFK